MLTTMVDGHTFWFPCRPLHLYNWKPLFLLNFFLMAFFFSASSVTGLVYAIRQLISNIHTFHWFAACYQCPKAHARWQAAFLRMWIIWYIYIMCYMQPHAVPRTTRCNHLLPYIQNVYKIKVIIVQLTWSRHEGEITAWALCTIKTLRSQHCIRNVFTYYNHVHVVPSSQMGVIPGIWNWCATEWHVVQAVCQDWFGPSSISPLSWCKSDVGLGSCNQYNSVPTKLFKHQIWCSKWAGTQTMPDFW